MMEISGRGGGGGKSGGGATRAAQEEANTLKSKSTARVLFLISKGHCEGLENEASSIFFDKTPLLSEGATSRNFNGVNYELRYGDPDQAYLTGFPTGANTYAVGVTVTEPSPVVRTISGPVDSMNVTISIPYLAAQNTSNGDLNRTELTFVVEKRVYGTSDWEIVHDVRYFDKCVATFIESFHIPLGGTNDWDIRVRRTMADSTSVALQNAFQWASYTTLVESKLIYPNCALVALTADAENFGSSAPNATFKFKGRHIRVPTNYNPVTRAYAGLWDGTFKYAFSDNPAWVLFDLLTDPDDGIGDQITEDDIDIYELYAIGQYCDESVENGFGGREPRFTFNYYMNQQMDAPAAMALVASTFNGTCYPAQGKILFFQNRPGTTAKIFTPANVRDGKFTYEGVALSARHSVANVVYFDPDNFCEPTVESVVDADLVTKLGYKEVNLTCYTTSRGQAHRMGAWALDFEKYATRTINFEASWTEVNVVPGEIVEVYDPLFRGTTLEGRLVSLVGNILTVDRDVTVIAGDLVKFIATDGQPYEYEVASGSTGSIVTLTASPIESAIVGAVFGISTVSARPRQCRVLSIKKSTDDYLAFTCIPYDPDSYARIEEGLVLDPVSFTRYDRTVSPAPVAIHAQEYAYRYTTQIRSAVTLTWTPFDVAFAGKGFDVEMARPGQPYQRVGTFAGTTATIEDVTAGEFNFRVRQLNYLNVAGPWREKAFTLFGVAAPPSDIASITVNVRGETADVLLSPVEDVDFDHYTIRYNATAPTWETALDLFEKSYSLSVTVPALPGYYLAKAVDIYDSESVNAAYVKSPVGSNERNVVLNVSDRPDWNGTLTDLTASAGALILDGLDEGSYEFVDTVDLGASYRSRILSAITGYAYRKSETWGADTTAVWSGEVGTWADIGEVWGDAEGTWETEKGTWAHPDVGGWNAALYYKATQSDPSTATDWVGWNKVQVSDVDARGLRFLLVITRKDPDLIVVVQTATVIVDMPDRTEYGTELVTSTGTPYVVVFTPSFRETPSVTISIRDGQSGDYVSYTSLPSASGFAFYIRNTAGNPVSRTIDYSALGYGKGA